MYPPPEEGSQLTQNSRLINKILSNEIGKNLYTYGIIISKCNNTGNTRKNIRKRFINNKMTNTSFRDIFLN